MEDWTHWNWQQADWPEFSYDRTKLDALEAEFLWQSEGLGHSALIALSLTINRGRKTYYELLERSNKGNETTTWLVYFARTVLEAQAHSQELVEFLIAKTKFYDRLRGQLSERQDKVIARMMREGPSGFKGGLSAENYTRLTGTSRATATRDLQALVRTGTLKGTLRGRNALRAHATWGKWLQGHTRTCVK